MKKTFIEPILIIILVILLIISVKKCGYKLIESVDFYEDAVGEEIIFKGDTLTIIDCSFLDNTFTLENGQKIDLQLIDQLESTQQKN
jgi:hypothetical protein